MSTQETDVRSIETSFAFPLSAVKPLQQLLPYRSYCVDEVRSAQASGSHPRLVCPACQSAATPWGEVEGLYYSECTQCSSIFIRDMPDAANWVELLKRVSERRNSPNTLNESIVQSRVENVYAPKLDWLNNTLRLHGMTRPRVVEITTLPSPFTQLLEQSPLFAEVTTIEQNQFSLPLAPAD